MQRATLGKKRSDDEEHGADMLHDPSVDDGSL
jgi:hypothetical protein